MSIENLLIDLTAAIRANTEALLGRSTPEAEEGTAAHQYAEQTLAGAQSPKPQAAGRGRPRKQTEPVNNSPLSAHQPPPASIFGQSAPEPSTTATPPASEAAPSVEAANTATNGQATDAAPSAPPATQTAPAPAEAAPAPTQPAPPPVNMEEFSKVFLELYETNSNGVNGMQVVTAILAREGVKRAKELAADRLGVVYEEMQARLATAKGNGAASLL